MYLHDWLNELARKVLKPLIFLRMYRWCRKHGLQCSQTFSETTHWFHTSSEGWPCDTVFIKLTILGQRPFRMKVTSLNVTHGRILILLIFHLFVRLKSVMWLYYCVLWDLRASSRMMKQILKYTFLVSTLWNNLLHEVQVLLPVNDFHGAASYVTSGWERPTEKGETKVCLDELSCFHNTLKFTLQCTIPADT